MANAIWPIQIIGSGPDRISVEVSEDAYAGDAQFTLSVDGVQVDGVQTATAAHAQQQRQTFLVDGNFGPGSHVLGVNFLNDAYGGTPDTDRNLWLEQVQSGDVVNITTLPFFTAGLQTVGFAVPPPTVTIGAGPDVIGLHMAEDAYGGDAQFTVSIDGVQVGGVQTATALHNTGQDQLFQILGDFGTAPQSLTVNFLNDSYGGTPETDRNLYVTRIDRGGITNTYDRGLFFNGAATFRVGVPVPTGAVTLGSGPDSIVLGISEDAYLEHARFTISVDGTQIGNVQTATTSHGQLRSQPFTVLGDFGPGPHAVAVTFLNDAYGGTPDADRNLWVDSITYAGLTTSVRTGLFWNGATTFDVQEPAAVITGSSIVGPPGGHAVLNGTPGDDTIVARGSGNYISGNGGSDIVTASASGGDTIILGVAQDRMLSLKEVVAVSGAGNVVAAGDEAVSLSGAASDTIAKLGNGANTLALDGAGNVLETGSGINNLTMTGGDATIRILRQYPAVTPQVVDPSRTRSPSAASTTRSRSQ